MLRRLLDSKPDWWSQWGALGSLCYMQGRFAEAAECYTKAVQLSGDAECKLRRAAVYIQLGEGDTALVDLDAVGVRKGGALGTLLRGWAYLQLQRWGDAATQLRQWLAQSDGADPTQRQGVMLQCAWALLKKGEADPAAGADGVREAAALLGRVGAGPPGAEAMVAEARSLLNNRVE